MNILERPSPLETARVIIRHSATTKAIEHCADIIPTGVDQRVISDIAAWAAHFAIEMMRDLHKDDEIRQELVFKERFKTANATPGIVKIHD